MMARRPITRFNKRMEAALKRNDGKGRRGWRGWSSRSLYYLLSKEMIELCTAIAIDDNTEKIQKECADIANFAMMISDNLEKKQC